MCCFHSKPRKMTPVARILIDTAGIKLFNNMTIKRQQTLTCDGPLLRLCAVCNNNPVSSLPFPAHMFTHWDPELKPFTPASPPLLYPAACSAPPGTLNISPCSCFLVHSPSLRTYCWWFTPVLGPRPAVRRGGEGREGERWARGRGGERGRLSAPLHPYLHEKWDCAQMHLCRRLAFFVNIRKKQYTVLQQTNLLVSFVTAHFHYFIFSEVNVLIQVLHGRKQAEPKRSTKVQQVHYQVPKQ